ncbi:succinyl-diaminopimelate desuccinylase [Lichenifustis flavocetrariae]|uniref:Succinyl-diaminopimelate desuccinylase n=1 Tax=Lichenifustis flavocetrariae TaxID=2949735 RepID=A0AA41YZX3_9HYPH|nr:succinyl-diaminopimelate desuccinylase [Lichenifustis flavocetrariae]MCW6510198.1 succinyl-diaminopimelate desuccinylase [Lichenifustis flavocetrariae]
MVTTLSPVDLLGDLIRCPSVTPTEGGALQLLAGLLAEAGFSVERPTFSEPGLPDVQNLYARLGTASPCLVFAGHTDVVPPGDLGGWRHPPFSGEIADGMIYGRGACDMKGGVAASVAAVLAYIDRHGPPPGSIAFLITGDEEGPAVNGTPKLLAWAEARGERFDHCLLGEPTNPDALGDMIKIGRRGSLSGSVTVQGRQGHVAYPHRAENPIPPLLHLLQALLATPLDGGTPYFDPSNLEIVSVDVGNPSTNVIPAQATGRFNIRFNDLWTPETLEAELRRRLSVAGQTARTTLDLHPCNALAFLTSPGDFTSLVAEAVTAETGRQPALSTTGGTSDARFIVSHCPVVEFGLVGQTMHAVDEAVSLADVEALTRIYERVLAVYFSR